MKTKLRDQTTKLELGISCEKMKAIAVASEQSPPVTVRQQTIDYADNCPYLGSYCTSLEQVMQRSIRKQGWARQHPSSIDSVDQSHRARPPTVSVSTCDVLVRQCDLVLTVIR